MTAVRHSQRLSSRTRNKSKNKRPLSSSLLEVKDLDVADYDPSKFLRCHGNNDNDIKVWACAFEPSLEKPGETGNILATCGGDTVCFIDVLTGKVMKRYKDIDDESFYSIAWAVLEREGRQTSVLAAAGERTEVKMIHPDQLVVYDIIRGHRKRVNCLTFHPTATHLLFSGSADRSIILWNVGFPGAKDTSDHSPLLRINLLDAVGDPLSFVFSAGSNMLVSATEKGCFGWSLGKAHQLPSPQDRIIREPTMLFKLPKDNCSSETVDCLVSLGGEFVATKCVGAGEILVWNLEKHIKCRKKNIAVSPVVKLHYSKTPVKYISLGYAKGVLGVGDDKGRIYLYNLGNLSQDSTTHLKPSRVLEWPELENLKMEEEEIVVNTVAISSHHRYVIAGTDNNLVCVWQESR